MRLGATRGGGSDESLGRRRFSFRAESVAELDEVAERLDQHGLSAIASPTRTLQMSDDECIEFGEKAAELGIIISEVHFLDNVLVQSEEMRKKSIADGRSLLRKADLMRARCMLGLAGSLHPGGERTGRYRWGICAENFTDAWGSAMREVVLRILDGIELTSTTYDLEPERNCLFYQPEDCAQFIDDVGHPDFGMHLDMMNMVSQMSIFKTTELIDCTFELLGDRIHSAHLKDIRWGQEAFQGFVEDSSGAQHRVFVKLDECLIGDGELDYRTFLGHLAKMDVDFPCMCEHLAEEDEYVTNFNRLHALADQIGTPFVRRSATQVRE
jgi:sugar phosphate isomerase/epimerase